MPLKSKIFVAKWEKKGAGVCVRVCVHGGGGVSFKVESDNQISEVLSFVAISYLYI